MNKDTKAYLSNVRSSFPVFQKNERRFYVEFKSDIIDFEILHPNCNMIDLNEKFGNPQEIAVNYFSSMDSQRYLKLMRKSLYLKIVTFVALILLLIFFIFQTYSLYKVRKNATKAIVTNEEIIINYD